MFSDPFGAPHHMGIIYILFLTTLAMPNKQYFCSIAANQCNQEESSHITCQHSLLHCLAEFDLVTLVHM
ncbi:hypothetical protein CROQUDRAFT_88684 [Cronartium quercuum f. sp. fusiforme G11]|uniref:Uncharacterized protein n=1 Tax=Cronartium quercuum f. sp. fusiforme G11 TaxID=708437 RepID=A0A9P6NQK0_9BASI|nr:hypothetical protein CROQUDRAFT_88684 [Cronartium quercuum f. sp. fusiforme G11]